MVFETHFRLFILWPSQSWSFRESSFTACAGIRENEIGNISKGEKRGTHSTGTFSSGAFTSSFLWSSYGLRSSSWAQFYTLLRLVGSPRSTWIGSWFSRHIIPLLTTDSVVVAQHWRTWCDMFVFWCSVFGVSFLAEQFSEVTLL